MALVSRQNRTPEPVPSAAGAGLPLRRLCVTAMEGACEITYTAPGGDPQAAAFEKAAEGWVRAFEARYSPLKPGSIAGRINEAAGREWVEVDAETDTLLTLCETLSFMTRGLLDPSVLPLTRLWDCRAAAPRVPSPEAISQALRLTGWSKVRREPGRILLPERGMGLDFGAFAKEYAVDMVCMIARDHGIGDCLVGFGHDLRASGAPPGRPAWPVGLEDPGRPGSTWASVGLSRRAIASSGDGVRCFTLGGRRYGHIIDPRTGWPVANGCTQATVIADSCLQAGMLSTAAFIAGVEGGLELIRSSPGAEGTILAGRERAQTRGFLDYVDSRQ